MAGRSLQEALSPEIFRGKRVCIDEVLPQNVDFLVVGLADALGLSIFTFNETADHYKRIAACHNKQISVKSLYDEEYSPSGIIDDVWNAADICRGSAGSDFSVYRSNTCRKADWYEYDIVVRVQPLDSGVSADIDGKILVFSRERKHLEVRYKVLRNRTVYYPQ